MRADVTPLLDVPALLAPVPGADPAGAAVAFEVRADLEERRREEDPEDFAADDPTRAERGRKADWAGVVRVAREALTHTSKDLLVAARLTEALVRLHGFAGLRDGLRLLRGLVDECWDRLQPPLEDGDPEPRAGPFHWLDEPDRGARLPVALRRVKLVSRRDDKGEASYGRLHWDSHQRGSRNYVSREDYEAAVLATPADQCRARALEIDQALAEVDELTRSLASRMGPAAPGLDGLRHALEDCRKLMQQIVRRRCPEPMGGGTASRPARPRRRPPHRRRPSTRPPPGPRCTGS